MKKLFFAACAAFVCSGVLFSYSLQNRNLSSEITMTSVESLADGEYGGDVIKCKCSAWPYIGNNECKSSNKGSGCAQSEAGGNIHCQSYNSNC